MFETLRADMSRAMRETRNDPDWKPTWRNKLNVALRHSTWPVTAYRYGHWTLGVRIPVDRPVVADESGCSSASSSRYSPACTLM